MKVFCSGGSGLGKSTLCSLASQELSIPFIHGQARALSEKNPDFFKWSFIDRQKLIISRHSEYYKNNDTFITDRSIFDYIVWTKLQYKEDEYYNNVLSSLDFKDTYIIIAPTPPRPSYYEVNEEKLREDVPRDKSYSEMILHMYGEAGIAQWGLAMWSLTRYLEFEIRSLANKFHDKDKIFHSDFDTDYGWQKESLNWLQSIIGKGSENESTVE